MNDLLPWFYSFFLGFADTFTDSLNILNYYLPDIQAGFPIMLHLFLLLAEAKTG
jgi:hypothetical protein